MDVSINCPCPGSPHLSDTVTLRDRLDYRSVTTIRKSMETVWYEDKAVQLAERLAVCTEFYMLMGITSWTLVDEKGKPVPVSHAAIRERLFEGSPEVVKVSEAAEEMYNRVVLLPLMEGASTSSPPTPTDESTSAMSEPTTPPKPSKPSSTTTSRTAGTETITSLPVGGSSSSQSAKSAA